MAKAYAQAVLDNIAALFKQGVSVPDIEAQTGVSHVTIRKYLKAQGFDLPDNKPRRNYGYYTSPEVIERIVSKFENGTLMSDIIRQEQMTGKTVRRILVSAGAYTPRSRAVKEDGAYEVSAEEFIRTWQTSNSARQVEQKLGLTRQAVNSRVNVYRQHGVPLKKMKRQPTNDWGKLAEFARQFNQEDES